VVSFLAYATIFGFRKTYTAGTFDGVSVFGLGYKEVLVIVQAIGYLSSKFFGIRFIAELKRYGRWKAILLLVGISWIAWLFFALVPPPYNIVFIFLNGFPLGLIWGIVFSYVEGRRTTDMIGAALAVSFIFSSGIVKSIGQFLMVNWNVSEHWMPFVAGALFLVPLVVFVLLMEKIPPPADEDVALRTERLAMNSVDRKSFVRLFFPGIALLVLLYMFLTIFRDVRDNFVADMWKEMGYLNQPQLFTKTETPITLAILVLVASVILIKQNFKAFMVVHLFLIVGFSLAGISSYLFIEGVVSPFVWIMLTGMGLYMGYIPYNCILFERLIAAFRKPANVGFLIYVADSFAYVGSVSVILSKAIMQKYDVTIRWTDLYSTGVMWLSIVGVAGTVVCMGYFVRKRRTI
jgi:MFS family permease